MQVLDFIHDTTWADLPAAVQDRTNICLLDLCGSLAGGRMTPLSRIIYNFACQAYGGDQATLLLDGRQVSAPGAALATGMTIDALDIHDSHRTSLGHAGIHIFASLLALVEYRAGRGMELLSGRDFLTALAVGYDLACRAGEALHGTVCDYHTSGAWGAVSSAALYARLMGLNREQTRHALGIAEYHGPRSQMMRCIDHPTMLKDGSGWGTMCGVSAGMMAEQGFTGAPAITIEAPEAAAYWATLGDEWAIHQQEFKAHGVCWWAQPAIEAALYLRREHELDPAGITHIRIETFEKATHLNRAVPENTEQAQYNIPIPVAAALLKPLPKEKEWGGLGPAELFAPNLHNPQVLTLARRVELVEDKQLTGRFPQEMLARVTLTLADGRQLASPVKAFRSAENEPFTNAELLTKYRWLTGHLLSAKRVQALEGTVLSLHHQPTIQPLLDCLTPPPNKPLPTVCPSYCRK